MGHYSFDFSLKTDSSQVMKDLTASATVALVNASNCVERSCAYLPSGSYLDLPDTNFGINSELTFSVWFKPMQGSTTDAPLFDVSSADNLHRIRVARKDATDKVEFFMRKGSTGATYTWISGAGVWVHSEWRHIVWSIEVLTAPWAWWRVYIDGELAVKTIGIWPDSVGMAYGRIGKGTSVAAAAFVGYVDSLYVIKGALEDNDARAMYMVSLCIRVPVFVGSTQLNVKRGLVLYVHAYMHTCHAYIHEIDINRGGTNALFQQTHVSKHPKRSARTLTYSYPIHVWYAVALWAT